MTKFLKASWENIIMANYQVPKEVLLPYLPKGLELDLYKGNAYVSLVGFLFTGTKLFSIPIPYFGTFEEINLRFYVLRREGGALKRGVVFINETVPHRMVALMANLLYKEKYSVAPTKHQWDINEKIQNIKYDWSVKNKQYSIKVKSELKASPIELGSFEEFIFEHYYGYTKVDEHLSEEYKIDHQRWEVNQVKDYTIRCDFAEMYGETFTFLNQNHAHSVFLAKGSSVSIDWKRTSF